jgi:hypothetical protein
MIVAGSASPLLLASAGGYNLTRSLRFRSSASAYLNRTPASAGNRKTWTWSAWVKRGSLADDNHLFSAGSSASAWGSISLNASNLTLLSTNAGINYQLVTTQVFRDPSAWYHIVVAMDTTQATSSNRIKIYVNGSQVTSFSTSTYPSLNLDTWYSSATQHGLGRLFDGGTAYYFDGYMTEINFIDGQALTPSSFGANNASTGVWQPKRYAGTYGTNGFYLPFSNNASTTTLGNDFSGNGNNWTTNNISLTAGSTYDSMTDVPTLTSATAANYCVMNPLQSGLTLAGANLNASGSDRTSLGSIYISSGKWYFEATLVSSTSVGDGIGIAQSNVLLVLGGNYSTGTFNIYQKDGSKRTAAGAVSYGASYTANDVIGVAFDADAGTLTFYKNNVSQGTAFTGLTGLYAAHIFSPGTSSWSVNFGQRPFAYTPPTGFVALNTFNLPTPTIGATASTQAGKYFNPVLWTGDGTNSRTISGVGFQPDFVWVKSRSTADGNALADSVRGMSNQLYSNGTEAENTYKQFGFVSANTSDGFTLSNGASGVQTVNTNGASYVAWNWKANGTGVTNTAGSITSTVSANTSAGFSVVTYTGNGSAGSTIGHGLGVAPKMVIVKCRNATSGWIVGHTSIGFSGNYWLVLNTTNAATNATYNMWNSTNPSSTVVTLGNDNGVNVNGQTYVAYCFSEVAGYSKFGSYTGNGSADGTFVYTGFRPRYVLMKRTNAIGNWILYDTARNTYNLANNMLFPNTSDADDTSGAIDIVSNGFKARSTSASWNGSGDTYIYMAFAENPFKYSLAR